MDTYLREKVSRGTKDFPFQLYSALSDKVHHDAAIHWHPETEIIYVESGRLHLFINETEYTAKAGDIYIINSQALHSLTITDIPTMHYAYIFPLELLHLSLPNLFEQKVLLPLQHKQIRFPATVVKDSPAHAEIVAELRELIRYRSDAQLFPVMVIGNLIKIVQIFYKYQLFTENESEVGSDCQIDRIKTALTYIDEHYAEKIFLGDLAGKCCVSEKYFCRIFKQFTGQTAFSYLSAYRIKKAAELLLNTHKKIIEIALDTGFENVGLFIRQFKQATGKTPSAYRSEIKNRFKQLP